MQDRGAGEGRGRGAFGEGRSRRSGGWSRWDVDPGGLQKIAEAKVKIEARAEDRYERELAEHEAKLAARAAKEKATGKKPGGKPPAAPTEGPPPSDQVNLTDEESRIMPVSGGGFEQCYNAQAAVAEDSLLVVANGVTQAPNDKRELEPMLAKTNALPEALGKTKNMLADSGYFSEANVNACAAAGIEPLIAPGRQNHHPSLSERFAGAPPAPENPTPVQTEKRAIANTPQPLIMWVLTP